MAFAGNLPNPLPFMKRAAVLALSSIWEALPTVLIEGLAADIPIVSTDCPVGPREILCDGAYGTLVPVGDSAALGDALLGVIQSRRRAVVPKEMLARFQYDQIVTQYLRLLAIGDGVQQSLATSRAEQG